MPEHVASLGIKRDQVPFRRRAQDNTAGGGKTSRREGQSGNSVFPAHISGFDIDGPKARQTISVCCRIASAAHIKLAWFVFRGGAHESKSRLTEGEIHGAGLCIVRRRLPVRAPDAGKTHHTLWRRAGLRNDDRPALAIESVVPALANEGPSQQKLSVSPVQHIEQTVAICLQNQLAMYAGKNLVRENQVLGGIPIMTIAGGELIVPLALSRGGIERDHRARKKIVAIADIGIEVGAGISHAPIEHVLIGIVATGEPSGRAPLLPRIAFPGIVAKFAGLRNRIKAPHTFAGDCVIAVDEAAYAKFAARYTDYYLVLDCQWS